MKILLEIAAVWLALNVIVVIHRIYVAHKREQFLRWHDQECSETRKRWGIM